MNQPTEKPIKIPKPIKTMFTKSQFNLKIPKTQQNPAGWVFINLGLCNPAVPALMALSNQTVCSELKKSELDE